MSNESKLKMFVLYNFVSLGITAELFVAALFFYVLGMYLSQNTLSENLFLMLLLAGLIGGFCSYGVQLMVESGKQEHEKLKKESYGSRLFFWFKKFIIYMILVGIIGFISPFFGINPFA